MRDDGHNFLWDGKHHVCQKCRKTPKEASGYGDQIMPCRPRSEFDLCESAPARGQHWRVQAERPWARRRGEICLKCNSIRAGNQERASP